MSDLSEKIIGCSYVVANELGNGFLEKVYEQSLAFELEKCGIQVELQKPIQVLYKGQAVGIYYADLVVEGRIIVELKTVKSLNSAHMAQCLHYLKATGITLALLINFGTERVQIQRIVNNY